MSSDAAFSTRTIELETLLRQREAQNEQLVTEMTLLRRHLAKQPVPSTSEAVALPPGLLSLLLPHLVERGTEASSNDGSHGHSHSAALALTQRAKLLQEENDELYELLKHSKTGGLMEEIRGLRQAVRRMEGALQESHSIIHSLSTELDKCYETLSRPSDAYHTRHGHAPPGSSGNNSKTNTSASRPIPTGPRKRARVSSSPQQHVRPLPPTGPAHSRGSGSPSPRARPSSVTRKMEVDERSPDRYRRDRGPVRRRPSKEGETEGERERERARDREREERDSYGRRTGRDRDRRVGGARGTQGNGRGLAERMGL